MTFLTQAQAKALITNGKAVQIGLVYQEFDHKTFGVLDNFATQKSEHYAIGEGDLRKDVPETTPTFR